MIERLTSTNLADITTLGKAFAAEADYPGGFEFSAFRALWSPLIDHGIGEILVMRDDSGEIQGAIGASYISDPFSGRPTAAEQFWYVMLEHRRSPLGVTLFEAFEDEAKSRGVEKIIMIHLEKLTPERLRVFLEKRGYAAVEQTFWKVLGTKGEV